MQRDPKIQEYLDSLKPKDRVYAEEVLGWMDRPKIEDKSSDKPELDLTMTGQDEMRLIKVMGDTEFWRKYFGTAYLGINELTEEEKTRLDKRPTCVAMMLV